MPVAGLAEYCPQVANLSFARNHITSLSALDAIGGLKNVRELVFIGNPVVDIAKQAGKEAEYRGWVLSKIISLHISCTHTFTQRHCHPVPHAAVPGHGGGGSDAVGGTPAGAQNQRD